MSQNCLYVQNMLGLGGNKLIKLLSGICFALAYLKN